MFRRWIAFGGWSLVDIGYRMELCVFVLSVAASFWSHLCLVALGGGFFVSVLGVGSGGWGFAGCVAVTDEAYILLPLI